MKEVKFQEICHPHFHDVYEVTRPVQTPDDSADLVSRWRQGDQQAANELFYRYSQRLHGLVRTRLSDKLAPRLDPEDVLQSAYRSFFIGARDGKYVLERSGDLWRLLVGITLHKLHHQIERHTADKRAVGREQALPSDSLADRYGDNMSREPSPAEAAAVVDELEQVMRGLQPLHRKMVELRLQGYLFEEIAAEVSRSERMVRLVVEQVKKQLELMQQALLTA